MKSYRVIWTYVANHGSFVLQARSPWEAAERVRSGFSDDFRARGTIYVAEEAAIEIFKNDPATEAAIDAAKGGA